MPTLHNKGDAAENRDAGENEARCQWLSQDYDSPQRRKNRNSELHRCSSEGGNFLHDVVPQDVTQPRCHSPRHRSQHDAFGGDMPAFTHDEGQRYRHGGGSKKIRRGGRYRIFDMRAA